MINRQMNYLHLVYRQSFHWHQIQNQFRSIVIRQNSMIEH